jgi:hypothetical protein
VKIEQVKKLSPLERFLYWISERHAIALRRKAGQSKPWTDDEILQSVFFTHPYREMDKTTVWFRENVRDLLRYSPEVFFATVCFRWFNLISTGEVLIRHELLTDWNEQYAVEVLEKLREEGKQIFTGAFMINSPPREPKLEAICRRINNVWEHREHITTRWDANEGCMEAMHDTLTTFDGMGGFMAYEVVCDLRYTYLLENAPDTCTWCNVGPGARRGLYRVKGVDYPKGDNSSAPKPLPNEMEEMRNLLTVTRLALPNLPAMEMREIEMSLCEVDKYERILWGDGRVKRIYQGV